MKNLPKLIFFFILSLSYVAPIIASEGENLKTTFQYDQIACSFLIEESEACSIYLLEDENGTIIYQVIAAVATAWLPEIVEGFCERTVGDPDICNAVYDVTSMVVALRGNQIYNGITRGLSSNFRWIANRGYQVSKATVEARTYNIASGIKTVFEMYKERCSRGDGIPWENVRSNSAGTFNSSYHSFYRYKECRFGIISGNRVNFRTTPSVETYNKITPQLTLGEKVSVIGYKIPEGGAKMRLVKSRVTFYYGNNQSFPIEKGVAVQLVKTYDKNYDLVLLDMKDGSKKEGLIQRSYLEKMDNKPWYKISAHGRQGWVYGDFINIQPSCP